MTRFARDDPPEPPEPPEDGLLEHEIAVAACLDCRDVVGPTHAQDVGHDLHLLHEGHETEVVARWTEVTVLDEYFIEREDS